MTEQQVEYKVGPLVQVVLPGDAHPQTFAASDLGLDLSVASDKDVIDAALRWIDVDPAAYPSLVINRPTTGNIVISPKAVFGATRKEIFESKQEISSDFERLLNRLKASKPDDRSEEDRCWAVTITELEKVIAYYEFWVIG
jgi:hypothetical protein